MIVGVRAHDFHKQTPEDLAVEVRKAGFDAVQLAPYKALEMPAETMLSTGNVARIRKAFESANLSIAVLGCYVEPGAADEAAWQNSLDRFRAHVRIAKDLGAACVGTETTRFSGTETEREYAFERVLSFTAAMAEEAERVNAVIAIEPVAAHTIHTPEMARRLLDKVNSSRLGIIFDPVNLLSADKIQGQDALWDKCLELLGPHIAAIHIKDGYWKGETYIPTPLGQGVMHFEPIFRWVREKHPATPMLREEAVPNLAEAEIRFIRETFSRC